MSSSPDGQWFFVGKSLCNSVSFRASTCTSLLFLPSDGDCPVWGWQVPGLCAHRDHVSRVTLVPCLTDSKTAGFVNLYPFSRGAYFFTYLLKKHILKILCRVLDIQAMERDYLLILFDFLVQAVRQLLQLLRLASRTLGRGWGEDLSQSREAPKAKRFFSGTKWGLLQFYNFQCIYMYTYICMYCFLETTIPFIKAFQSYF